WNSFCFFSLLLCRACKSLAICWECLSLFIHMCWRRVVDWLALILEYTIGGSVVPRGIYPNLVWLCILPFFLAHQEIPGIDIIVDPCAAIIVLFVTGLLHQLILYHCNLVRVLWLLVGKTLLMLAL
ncbi:hypothetical protein CICLE_v10030345mg, partial [Citrus x clementina]